MIGPAEIPFDRLIAVIRNRLGDAQLPVVVGMDAKEDAVFAKAHGVAVSVAISRRHLFWSMLFSEVAEKLAVAIAEKEPANG